MIIPINSLSPDALRGIIEANVIRGADLFEGDMEQEILRITQRIQQGDLVIVYSAAKDDVTLVPKELLGNKD